MSNREVRVTLEIDGVKYGARYDRFALNSYILGQIERTLEAHRPTNPLGQLSVMDEYDLSSGGV